VLVTCCHRSAGMAHDY